ncbi:MAG: cysteine desulfurase [Firmicutes bacterium]|nr:cysteine desulfurase [Candidatus Fiminaster equi]
MVDKIIYLDNAATTRPSKDVVALYNDIELNHFGNSSSIHGLGVDSLKYLTAARETILNSFKVKNYKVYFTGSSTEANNLAIKGFCYKHANRGKHIITTNIEHPSVLECFRALENDGFKVTYLKVNAEGIVTAEDVKNAMTNETILVSVMAVNNEIGSINPIKEIKEVVLKFPKTVLHVDTTQAVGKINLDYNNCDMFVVSSHKIHGLKGSGALIAKSSISFDPVISGGGQEDGMRSGTVSVANACALAKAVKNLFPLKNIEELSENLRENLNKIDGIEMNSNANCTPYIINFSLTKKKASVVVEALSNKGIYVSSVSACNSKGESGSYVVKALGKSDELAHNTIRVSLDNETTLDELEKFTLALKDVLEAIK